MACILPGVKRRRRIRVVIPGIGKRDLVTGFEGPDDKIVDKAFEINGEPISRLIRSMLRRIR